MNLIEKGTGKVVTFDDPAAAQAAFMTGKYGVQANQTFGVAGPDGGVYKVKGADLYGAMTASQGTLVSNEDLRKAELEAKHGGVVGTAKAAAAGAARGLTLGLSDVALSKFGGDETRQTLEELKEAHPYASAGGEIVGAVAPTLLTGGAGGAAEAANLARLGAEGVEAARGVSALARAGEAGSSLVRGAGILPRAVAGAGELTERGVISMLGEGSGLGSRAVRKAAAMGARGAVEGAAYGAGSQISEDALGDHELTAEHLLSAVGHGALYGAAGGALLAGGGEVAGSALKGIGGKLSPTLERMADEQAWKSLSPLKKFSEEAEARAGGTSAVGRTLREEGIIGFGDDIEKIAPKVAAAKERVGEQLGEIVSKSGGRIHYEDVVKAFEEVIGPLRKKALHEPIVASLEEAKESLFSQLAIDGKGTVSVQDLVAQRKALDAMAYQEAKALDPRLRVQFLRDIRSGLDKLEVKAIDDAAARLNPSDRGAYKALKTKFQHLSIAEKAAETTSARMVTNRNFSLTDYITGVGGVASGHPGLVAMAGVNKVLRERGNASAAFVLGKLADITAIQRTAMQTERRLVESVDSLLAPTKPKPRFHRLEGGKSEDTESEYKRRVAEVQARVSEPYRAAAALVPMTAHAPKTAAALADAAHRTTAYLSSKIPAAHQDRDSLTPQATRPTLTAQQMHAFNRVARVADDPLSILDAVQHGTLSSDQVEAFKTVAPKTYDDLRMRVANKLAEQKTPLSPAQDLQIRTLFGLRTGSLDPKRVAMLQQNFAGTPNDPGQKKAMMAKPSHIKNNVDLLTPAQKAAQAK